MAPCGRVWAATLVLCAALAADARGRQLLEVDGVELRGTEQLVQSGGGTCRVLESDTSYEARKDNHGAPMDVWRLDFTVRNGSGRWLDHLIARFQIEAEWPDCTNWDGPDGASFAQPIEWADSAGHIQESGRNVVAPGQTLTATKFFVVLRGDPQPRFANWSMDFDFAAGPSPATPPVSPQSGAPAGPAGPAASELPPEIQADLHLRRAEQAVREGDAATARAAMERLDALQSGHGLEPAAEDHYRHAQAWAAAGEPGRAVAAAVRYLQAGGRDAEHYTEALDLINREGTLEAAPAARNTGAGRVSPEAPAGTAAAAEPRAGESREFDGMEFVWIPAGEFRMGSTSSASDDDERPLTAVRISRGFWMGKHEVTQGQWEAVMGSNPSHVQACGAKCPVERVSWNDVQGFIRRLNGRTRGSRYRLPTEAEWEYSARAGSEGDTYAGDLRILGANNAPVLDGIAWYGGNSGVSYSGGHDCSDWEGKQNRSERCGTHPVGRKKPNAWGLHDMLGNVNEWVEDWYGEYPGGAVTDPEGPSTGSYRVLRGGGWPGYAKHCRAANRSTHAPGARHNAVGLRLLRIEQ